MMTSWSVTHQFCLGFLKNEALLGTISIYSFICIDNRIHLRRIAFLGHSPIRHEKYPVRESTIESNDDISMEHDVETFHILQNNFKGVRFDFKGIRVNDGNFRIIRC